MCNVLPHHIINPNDGGLDLNQLDTLQVFVIKSIITLRGGVPVRLSVIILIDSL